MSLCVCLSSQELRLILIGVLSLYLILDDKLLVSLGRNAYRLIVRYIDSCYEFGLV